MTEVTERCRNRWSGTHAARSSISREGQAEAPVMGEDVTVCRNGRMAGTPGARWSFPPSVQGQAPTGRGRATRLFTLITATQAIFLPALFTREARGCGGSRDTNSDGLTCQSQRASCLSRLRREAPRVSESRPWVAAGYAPRRFEITPALISPRRWRFGDLAMFSPSQPARPGCPPYGRCNRYSIRRMPTMPSSACSLRGGEFAPR